MVSTKCGVSLNRLRQKSFRFFSPSIHIVVYMGFQRLSEVPHQPTISGVLLREFRVVASVALVVVILSFVSEFKKSSVHSFNEKVGILLTNSTIRFAVHHKVRGNAKPFAYLKP